MRVAIDATPLTVPAGGIRRYVVELTRALAEAFPDDEFHLLSDQPIDSVPGRLAGLGNLHWDCRPRGGLSRRWWSLGLPRQLARNQIDVFHGTDFSIPYLPLRPSVVTVHDLSPWLPPPLGEPAAARIRRRTPQLLRLASMIVTPSEAIRGEVSDFFGISKQRIRAVPHAASELFSPAAAPSPAPTEQCASPAAPFPRVAAPYFMWIGPDKPRKNLSRLIEAWRIARRQAPGISLLAVGLDRPETLPAEDGLTVFGKLPDEKVSGLLSQALGFVYPSLYEGFGLPVLEAMRLGTPVITSRDAAIRETAGGAAIHVDVTSPAALAAAMLELAAASSLRSRLRERGLDQASRFSWPRAAALTHSVYVDAIRRF